MSVESYLLESRALLDNLIEKTSDAYGKPPVVSIKGPGGAWLSRSDGQISCLNRFYKKWEEIAAYFEYTLPPEYPIFNMDHYAISWSNAVRELSNYYIFPVNGRERSHEYRAYCHGRNESRYRMDYWTPFQLCIEHLLKLQKSKHMEAFNRKITPYYSTVYERVNQLERPSSQVVDYEFKDLSNEVFNNQRCKDEKIQSFNKSASEEIQLLEKAISYEKQMLDVERVKLTHMQDRMAKINAIQSKLNG